MRILYLITKSEIGGAQIHLAHLLRHFSKESEIALMSVPGGWLNQEAFKYGVKIYPNSFFGNSFNPFNLGNAMHLINQAVKDFKPNLICCHSSMAGFLGRLTVKGKVPTIYTAHGFAFTPDAPLWRRVVAIIGEKLVSKYTSRIICVSEFDKQLALKNNIAPAEKIAVVYNGVEIKLLNLNKEKKETVDIVNIGRLAYPKRPDLAVKAFAKLPMEFKNKTRLSIIGGGPYKENLSDLVSKLRLNDSVSFLETDHEEVLGLLEKADIFILITKHEGLPMTILEAMSAGLPVIASKVGGIPEEVSKESGILIEDNDVSKISEALISLIKNKEKRIKMGLAGRKRAEELFSLQHFFAETRKVYTEAIK